MQIVYYPHPALRQVAKPVPEVNDGIRRIAREMLDLMYAAKGIGLAGPQVAVPLRLFVLNPKSDDPTRSEERVFINPQIVERKGLVEEEEGCLSVPGVYAKLKRAERVKVTAQDLNGATFELETDGLAARAIQHEVDHLQGILFIDKAGPLEKIRIIGKLKDFEREFRRKQEAGEIPPNAVLVRALNDFAVG
jgi:peptide deformylase